MKETILIVDDTPENLKVISSVLLKSGYRIQVAEDGAMALDVVRTEKPDLILLDVMMPNMDGFETCQRLKASENTKDIPILFMTALSATGDKVKGFELGAVDYITKPFQQEEVLARIHTHLTLARQKRELEKMLEERSRFMRMAIHDLRNPLSAIIGWSELGAMAEALEESKFTFLRVQEAANWLNDIINDFLALQNLSKPHGTNLPAAFDLPQLLLQAIDQHRSTAEKKSIGIVFTPPPDAVLAFGSYAGTHQIVSNYLSNAIKFSPSQKEIAISMRVQAGHWLVEVKDQGPGIAPDERALLFKEFARISSISTAEESSTRLGLAIVKRLAEAQGGAVGASFPQSGGSVFHVEIPMAPVGY
jgi:DNA-binding response OmpR family regulator